MPQLDTSTFLSQVFWFFFTFITFYLWLSIIVLPKIKGIFLIRKTLYLYFAKLTLQAKNKKKKIDLSLSGCLKETFETKKYLELKNNNSNILNTSLIEKKKNLKLFNEENFDYYLGNLIDNIFNNNKNIIILKNWVYFLNK
uniref:ATP synthase F0 subunit 8 n=1 Tax=Cyanoptyche gloeocystis TaxID=77922 RepID=A0A096Y6U4_9EUKA|nr:ATP synthase F0 subunit 8 [Cyanoptyche gloeocystis]AIM52056.1 ATP synthase F0 subunit 8 [Cyanoptyche gloeocystis]